MNRIAGVFVLCFAMMLGLMWLKIHHIEKSVNYTMQSVLNVEEQIDKKGKRDE